MAAAGPDGRVQYPFTTGCTLRGSAAAISQPACPDSRVRLLNKGFTCREECAGGGRRPSTSVGCRAASPRWSRLSFWSGRGSGPRRRHRRHARPRARPSRPCPSRIRRSHRSRAVAAGAFVPPGGRGGSVAAPWADLPEFCRISATTKMLNSEVKFEVWMPARGWSGDFQPAGSSFWGGAIPFGRMRTLVKDGAATVGTNLGIEGFAGPELRCGAPREAGESEDGSAACGHRAGKTLADQVLRNGAAIQRDGRVRWRGIRDVMAEVQRFPADLDAAVAR